MIGLDKAVTETELEYIWRLGCAKDNGTLDMSWKQLGNIFNKNLGYDWDESAYRKKFQSAQQFYDEIFTKMIPEQYSKDVMDQKRELERAKITFRDERNAWNKQNYSAARVNENLDLLEKYIKTTTDKTTTLSSDQSMSDDAPEMIVCLFDWHIGAEFYSFRGCYNLDIAKQRLEYLQERIKQIGKLHGIHKCFVSVGGDMISGSIHRSIQVSNRENVIEQIVSASRLLSDFIYGMAQCFDVVRVTGVAGNHSRIDKKEDALKDERLDDLLLWYIEADLSKCGNVHIDRETLDSTITSFDVADNVYAVVHGDCDSFTDASVCKLVTWLGYKPKGIIFGHRHYPAMSEVEGVTIIQTGSLCGSGDDFTIKSRLRGDASQTVLICNEHGIECCYPINLSLY